MKKRKLPAAPGQPRNGAFECRVDSRGRITLPKTVREYMHLEAGDRIEFTIRPMGGTRLGSAVPDQYYAVLKRLKRTVPKDIDLSSEDGATIRS